MFVCTSCGVELEAAPSGACPDCDGRVVPTGDALDVGPGRVLGGRYVLLELLGRGAMGVVYLGKQRALDKRVAIKVLSLKQADEEALRRFNHEAQYAARLDHPHNVKVFDFGHAEGDLAYIVMEVVRGRPLSRLEMPLPLPRVLAIATQICRALGEAHELGLVHRDLKPDNVMLSELDGEDFARVLDYGIAKAMNAEGTVLTQTGMMIGTPRYVSPEQAKGEKVDARSDIYSLGAMLFEMVTGRAPFDAPNPIAMALAHIGRAPPRPSELAPVPQELEALILACLAKEPARRPQTLREVLDRLREVGVGSGRAGGVDEAGATGVAEAAPAGDAPSRRHGSVEGLWTSSRWTVHRWVFGALAVALAVLIVLAAVLGGSGSGEDAEARRPSRAVASLQRAADWIAASGAADRDAAPGGWPSAPWLPRGEPATGRDADEVEAPAELEGPSVAADEEAEPASGERRSRRGRERTREEPPEGDRSPDVLNEIGRGLRRIFR